MKLTAVNVDITTLEVDAIVNAANSAMIIGGGVDGAIHAAAGQELINYNAQHHGFGCPTGQVKVTPGFNLPAKYILHTVGPDMRLYTEEMGDWLLTACYGNCMRTALNEGLKTIAFPAISTGIFGFNKERAARIAVEVMRDVRFKDADIEVTFACFGDEDTAIVQKEIDLADAIAHHLSWSIGEYPEDIDAEFIPDLDTDAPDGVYAVRHNHLGKKGRSYGVIVKDGKFVVEPTLRACAEARNDAGYWGTFLEGLKYDPKYEDFEASIGS